MNNATFDHPRPVARLGGVWIEVHTMMFNTAFCYDEHGLTLQVPIYMLSDWEIPEQHAEAIAPFKRKV